ncbi:hypothetical protein MMC26_004989 [Xylographa opegraphella]|nr:hypothetical protein [Xylographa opegraphella]
MSFGFGVGDLLAIANTIERIVSEIKSYRSAPSSFQRLAIELELLTKTCTQILQIQPIEADDATRMDNIRKSMCLCLGPLKAFAEKMRSSEDSLGVSKWLAENHGALNDDDDPDGNGGQAHQNTLRRRLRSVKDRIHWSMIESKEIDELRAVVAGQLVAVDTLLNVRTWACLTEANVRSDELSERLQSLINDTRAASDESRQFYLSAKAVAKSQWDEIERWQTLNEEERIELKKVILSVSESSYETRSWTKILANTVGLWGDKLQGQVGTLASLNNTLSAYMRRLVVSCASITEMIERNFHTLINVYEVLVRIERMILAKAIEMPHLRFDDPFGETLALPYQMCNTWQHFTRLLGAMFEDKPGKRLVQRGSFMIMTAKVNRIIDSKQWEHAVRSGDHLSMSMVLRRRTMDVQQCPRCLTWEENSQTQQKGRTCNACELWFSTLDEEPNTAGRIVTMGGERIELYEVPDAPRNDHSSSGPLVLPMRHVTSPEPGPISIGNDEDTDEDTKLFRRIHFIIQQFRTDTASVLDVSELDGVENIDLNFSPSGVHDESDGGTDDYFDRGEQPTVSITPPPISEGLKSKKPKKAKRPSIQANRDRSVPPAYRSPIPSPYYYESATSVHSRPRTCYYEKPVDGSRASRFSYYTGYGSDCRIPRSTGKVSHATYFLSREEEPIHPSEVDAIKYHNHSFYGRYAPRSYYGNKQGPEAMEHTLYHFDHNCATCHDYQPRSWYDTANKQSVSSRHSDAGRTIRKPAGRLNTTVRPPQSRTATETDRYFARIPSGYSLKNWDPTELPIMILGSVFDANSLGKWIYDWTVYHYHPGSASRELAGELWLLLIKFAGKIKVADNQLDQIDTAEEREMIQEFLDSGDRIWNRLKNLLKVGEDYMWRAYKRDNSKHGINNDGELQHTENRNESDNNENNVTYSHKEERAGEGGPKVKSATDVHMRHQPTADSESGHVQAEQESILVEAEACSRSTQIPTVDNELKDEKRGKPKSRASKTAGPVQLGKSSGIAFVEAIFGKDKELESTEKLMAIMNFWILRFDVNCGEILRPRSATQTGRRGQNPSVEFGSYHGYWSTIPGARTSDVDSTASWKQTRTRHTTTTGRSTHTKSRVATKDDNVVEVAGAPSVLDVEQNSSPFDAETQGSDSAKGLNEWDSSALTMRKTKKKKKKSKESVADDSNLQPGSIKIINDSEDLG